MRISSMKKITLLACVSLGLAYTLLSVENQQRVKNIHGNLLFSAAEQMDNVKKIKIESAQNKVTVYQDENLWKVVEADNYYANLKLVHNFLETVSKAKIGNEVSPETQKDSEWVTLSLYDAEDQKLDSVKLSNPDKVGAHYTISPDGKKMHLTNWTTNIPVTVLSWTQYPLIKFDSIEVKSLEKNGHKITRDYRGMTFFDTESNLKYRDDKHRRVFEILTGLWYDDVLSSQEFDEKRYPDQQRFKITSFDGLETEMTIYTNKEDYWAKVTVSTNKLPTQEIKNYVKNNAFLYEDWWFKLSPEDGKALFSFEL